jgi:5'-methylthioadenosine phosphorylase
MDGPIVTGSRLGLVVGSSLKHEFATADAIEQIIDTRYGPVPLVDVGDAIVLNRHYSTLDGYRPPHRLDHHRSITALCTAGCNRVLALGSVGSLRDWPVGTLVAPFDLFAPGINPTFFDDARGHLVPGFDQAWRDRILAVWQDATDSMIIDGGVYAQTTGPRFETPAEVRMLARYADIVGMTVASETILAKEAGLAYAAVCMVDNLGNGVADVELTVEQFRAGVDRNHEHLLADLNHVLPRLAATPRDAT